MLLQDWHMALLEMDGEWDWKKAVYSYTCVFLDVGLFPKGEVRRRHVSSVSVLLKPFLGLGHLSLEVFM